MVANPANTNALILRDNAPSIPAENITCMTRLDHNRALGQVGAKHLHTMSLCACPVACGMYSVKTADGLGRKASVHDPCILL